MTPEELERGKFELPDQCDYPHCMAMARRRRMSTCYIDDESNFATLCDEHYEETEEYWKDMWKEYYSGLFGVISDKLS